MFADGRLVYSTASSFNRPDIARRHGVPEGAGFVLELPLAVAGDAQEIRFVAVRGGVASELAYAAGYPWR